MNMEAPMRLEQPQNTTELIALYRQIRKRLSSPQQPQPQPQPPPPVPPQPPPPPPMPRDQLARITCAICLEFGVTRLDIINRNRDRATVLARHVAIALCRHLMTNVSTTWIGYRFKRDHTSIMHAIRRMAPLIDCAAGTMTANAAPSEWARFMHEKLAAGFELSRPRRRNPIYSEDKQGE
jgi:hypothetical protein